MARITYHGPRRRWRSQCPSLTDKLAGGFLWPLDDPSGMRRCLVGGPAGHLTDVNTVTTASGPPGIGGLCASFDGSTEYLYCADPFPPPRALSMVAWVYQTGGSAASKMIVAQGAASTSNLAFLVTLATLTPTFYLSPDGGAGTNVSSGAISGSTWTMLAGVWDGAVMTAYTNLTPGAPAAFASALYNSADALSIGANRLTTSPTNFFGGRIATPCVFPFALAPSEIAFLYADGTGRPLSDWVPPWYGARA